MKLNSCKIQVTLRLSWKKALLIKKASILKIWQEYLQLSCSPNSTKKYEMISSMVNRFFKYLKNHMYWFKLVRNHLMLEATWYWFEDKNSKDTCQCLQILNRPHIRFFPLTYFCANLRIWSKKISFRKIILEDSILQSYVFKP